MKKFFNNIVTDGVTFWGFLLSLCFMLLTGLVILFCYSKLPPFLPLYNAFPWGYARLGTKIELLLPLGITFLCFIGNLLLSATMYKKIPLIARLICVTTLTLTILVCFYSIKIINLIL